MTEVQPALIPLKAASHYAGIGMTKAYDLIDSGSLVAVKIGVKTLITRESLESYIANLPRVTLTRGRAKAA